MNEEEKLSFKHIQQSLRPHAIQFMSLYRGARRKVRWFTPIGNTDNLLRKAKSEKLEDSKYYQDYYAAFKKYSYYNRIYLSVRILLYAGLIASFAVAVGLPEFTIIQSIASYIGVTLILIFYVLFSFLTLRAREEYYLRRELLISDLDNK